jgi:mono/diheme cytochrome c family protein
MRGSFMKGNRQRPFRGMPFRKRSAEAKGRLGSFMATVRAMAILLAIIVVIAGIAAYSITRRGLSAHDEPSAVEAALARAMRTWATPEATRTRTNPLPATGATLADAMSHYADHCATCHANDGSGNTAIGQGMYPKAPDMRAAQTQSLTDGELFSIIEHGIRLTGMPGWGNGTPEGERDSWALVHFIRRLPKLSAEEIEQMEAMNPKSSEEWRQEEEARRFLAGDDITPKAATPQHTQH